MRLVSYGTMGTVLWVVVACFFTWGTTAYGDYTYGEPTKVPTINRPGGVGGFQISPDGLELFFCCPTEKDCWDLFVSRRSTTRESWGTPVRLDPPVTSSWLESNPCISADGLELYFSESNPAFYPTGCVSHPNGYGGGDLWVSRRTTRQDPWGNPQNLGPLVNTAHWEDHPSISADGLTLYFTSDRGGGQLPDLYVTTRQTKTDPWGSTVPVGGPINTQTGEWTPFISPDGLSLFFARGSWAPDIYVSRRATVNDPWDTPVLFAPVNSAGAEFHLSFASGDSTLYFLRGDNVYGPFDIWQVKVNPKVDFNGDGKVDVEDVQVMVDHWGQNYSLCDIGPFGWGDGVVDAQDLMVLAQYMVDHINDVNGTK